MTLVAMLSDAMSDKWDEKPSTRLKDAISKRSHNEGHLKTIMEKIWINLVKFEKCGETKGKNAKKDQDIRDANYKRCTQGFKSLIVIEHLAMHGSLRIVAEFQRRVMLDCLRTLFNFEADVGDYDDELIQNIREKSKAIVALVTNHPRLQSVRDECKEVQHYRNMVLAITENVEGLPTIPQMNQIVGHTRNPLALKTIMSTVWERLSYMNNTYLEDRNKAWNKDSPCSCAPMFLRTLTLLNFLINESTTVAEECIRHRNRIEAAYNFGEQNNVWPTRNKEVHEKVDNILELLDELQEGDGESSNEPPRGLLATRSPSPIRRNNANSSLYPAQQVAPPVVQKKDVGPIVTKGPGKMVNRPQPNSDHVATRPSSKDSQKQPTNVTKASTTSIADDEQISHQSTSAVSQSTSANLDNEQQLLMETSAQRSVAKRRIGSASTGQTKDPLLTVKRARPTKNPSTPVNRRLSIGEDEAMEGKRSAIDGRDDGETKGAMADLPESMDDTSINQSSIKDDAEESKKKKIKKRCHSTEAERLRMDEGVQKMDMATTSRRRSMIAPKDEKKRCHSTEAERLRMDEGVQKMDMATTPRRRSMIAPKDEKKVVTSIPKPNSATDESEAAQKNEDRETKMTKNKGKSASKAEQLIANNGKAADDEMSKILQNIVTQPVQSLALTSLAQSSTSNLNGGQGRSSADSEQSIPDSSAAANAVNLSVESVRSPSDAMEVRRLREELGQEKKRNEENENVILELRAQLNRAMQHTDKRAEERDAKIRELRGIHEKNMKEILNLEDQVVLAKQDIEKESEERKKTERKVAALENELTMVKRASEKEGEDMSNRIEMLQNEMEILIKEKEHEAAEMKKLMADKIAELQNEIEEGRQKEREEKRKMEEQIKSLSVRIEKEAQEKKEMTNRLAIIEGQMAKLLEQSSQMPGVVGTAADGQETQETQENENALAYEDENDEEMEMEEAEWDEENTGHSEDQSSNAGDEEMREVNEGDEDEEEENDVIATFEEGEEVFAQVNVVDGTVYPATVHSIRKEKDGSSSYFIKYEEKTAVSYDQMVAEAQVPFMLFKKEEIINAGLPPYGQGGFTVGDDFVGVGKSMTTTMERVLKNVKDQKTYALGDWVKARTSIKDRQFWLAKIMDVSTTSEGHTRYQVQYPGTGKKGPTDQCIQPYEVHIFLRKATDADKKQMEKNEKKKRDQQIQQDLE